MDKRLQIYVTSPDSYSDVFGVCIKAFKKYWHDCPYEFVLTTNSKVYDGITCICNHKTNDSFVSRTLEYLPRAKTKYVLLMCDDIIITHRPCQDCIEKILDYMDKNNVKFCRLNPLKGDVVEGLPYLSIPRMDEPYVINLQFGIFRTDFLLDLLGDGSLTGWDIEDKINEVADSSSHDLYDDVISVNTQVIPYIHGVDKGKWKRKAYKYIEKEYPEVNIERGRVSLFTEMKISLFHCFMWKLTKSQRIFLRSILHSICKPKRTVYEMNTTNK
jgi:hypothetical protein